MGLLVLASCSSPSALRLRPPKLDDCATVLGKIRTRDGFYKALRGRAVVKTSDASVDVELALAEPRWTRVEIAGPLGIRLGLLVLNPDWFYFFVPRERLAYRFPAPELERDTLRRENFLSLLPVPVHPEIFHAAVMSRVGLPDDIKGIECSFDEERVAYRVRIPSARGGRIVWIEPHAFYPDRILYFDGVLPPLAAPVGTLRPVFEARFSETRGAGLATLPTHVEIFRDGKLLLTYRWKEAEAWDSFDPKVFEWTPPASATLKDY